MISRKIENIVLVGLALVGTPAILFVFGVFLVRAFIGPRTLGIGAVAGGFSATRISLVVIAAILAAVLIGSLRRWRAPR